MPGRIVILNGAPRSGKSSIVAALQKTAPWMNLGVDVSRATTPASLQPGVGLRPGEPDHPAAGHVPRLYAALYESIAAHSRLELDVAVDVGHYDRAILVDAAQRVAGLPVLFVGVRCPLDAIMERRRSAGGERYALDEAAAQRWEDAVHGDWAYDLELDTSRLTPAVCAAEIGTRLASGPGAAFAALA